MEQLFTGTALLAVFAYIAMQLKSVPMDIWRYIKKQLVFSANIEEITELYKYFEIWLHDNHESTLKNVSVSTRYNRDGIEVLRVGHLHDVFVVRYMGKRILISKNRQKLDGAKDIFSMHFSAYVVEGWNAKKEIMALLEEVLTYNLKTRSFPKIFTNASSGSWYEVGVIKGKDIDNVFIEDKEAIITDINSFIDREKWYSTRGIPYKRGYIFHGQPGNGKTSFSLAIAKHFNRDLYVLNLNDLEKDIQLIRTFSEIKHNSILLIEDGDAILGSRDGGKTRMSFSALLNCMDGVYSRHGLIAIITTNHIERIDPALIREGRIDMKVRIDNPNKRMVEKYAAAFFNVFQVKIKTDNSLAMSTIQEILLQNKDNMDQAIEEIEERNWVVEMNQNKQVAV